MAMSSSLILNQIFAPKIGIEWNHEIVKDCHPYCIVVSLQYIAKTQCFESYAKFYKHIVLYVYAGIHGSHFRVVCFLPIIIKHFYDII